MENPTTTTSAPTATSIVFDEPRLQMSIAGRLLVRVITWITYLVLIAATFTMLISGIDQLRFVGVFFGFILIDLLAHRGEADLPIPECPKVGVINAAQTMRPAAFSVLERAFDTSVISKRDFYLEMTERLLESPEVEEALRRLDVSMKEFKQKLDEFVLDKPEVPPTRDAYIQQASLLGVAAFAQAIVGGHNFIEVGDLFSALSFVDDEKINRLFDTFGITASDIERALIFGVQANTSGLGRIPAALGGFVLGSHHRIRHRVMNRAWTSRPTPTLDAHGTDFTDLARDGSIGFLVGHAEEYERLVETLARPMNPNALLVGEAGIGKESIVQHLAFRLAKDTVPESLFDKRLVSLEIQSLVAGAPADVLSARLKTIVEEIYLAGNIILYVPDIHNLVRTSGAGYLSAADALMPVIMNNAFPIIGSTYPKEFKQFIDQRSDFTGAFEIIQVNEITEADAEKDLNVRKFDLGEAIARHDQFWRDQARGCAREEILTYEIFAFECRGAVEECGR